MVSIGYPDEMSEKKALVFPFFRRRYWGFAAWPSGQSSLSPCHCLRKLIEPVTETLVHAEVFSAAHSAQQQAAATENWPSDLHLFFLPSEMFCLFFIRVCVWNHSKITEKAQGFRRHCRKLLVVLDALKGPTVEETLELPLASSWTLEWTDKCDPLTCFSQSGSSTAIWSPLLAASR